MRLLFITQKLHGQDAFGVHWIEAFERQGYTVTVLCLEWRSEDAKRVLGRSEPFTFDVRSLGKEQGHGKIRQILRFFRYILFLNYDRVFIHMTPVWGLFGAPVWLVRRIPVYLWYTHYKMQAGLWLLSLYAKRLFCATAQSLPQYEGHSKKVVVGHGINLSFWYKRTNQCDDPKKLLAVHRLSRSKRLELALQALALLPEYSLDVYGIEAEPVYVEELRSLVSSLHLAGRVTFHGTVPVRDLPDLYAKYRLIINMASETIDKTMLEAMTCGCYPVTTRGNAEAIGLPAAPSAEMPHVIAAFVKQHSDHPVCSAAPLFAIVEKRHSLSFLVATIDSFMRLGQ